jgi:small-conductance mechanosensitive channel
MVEGKAAKPNGALLLMILIEVRDQRPQARISGRETALFNCMHVPVMVAMTSQSSSRLQWTLWTIIMSLIMGWVARSRQRPRPARYVRRLQHPPSTLTIGLAGFLFFAAIAVISNMFANATTTWLTTTVFVGFALLALPILGDYFAARHEVSEEGLRYGRLFGTGGHIRWADLKSVRYSAAMKWFRLESQSGTVVRVSVMLMGLPVFAQLLLVHAPPEAIDSKTVSVLQMTAEGNPPSVWGLSEG